MSAAQEQSAAADGAVRSTRRLARLAMPERTDPSGMAVTELEEALAELSGRYTIEHDLTAAHTGAFPPPDYFVDSVVEALRVGRPGYTPERGDRAVREAIAPRLAALLGIPVDPETELLITAGTQAALFASLATLVQSGDTMMLADPEYLCDERAVRFFGADIRYVPFTRLGPEASLDLDAVERAFHDGARVLLFSNPHNPTGSVMGADALRQLAELVVAHDGYVIADELYARFVYDDAPVAHIAAMPGMRERCLTAIGPSKTESASGFRVGVLVGPPQLMRLVAQVVPIMTVRAPSYSQYGLLEWMRDDDQFVRDYVGRYRVLRDIAVDRLAAVEGVELTTPAATAWLFPDLRGLGRTQLDINEALMAAGILGFPGAYFGPAGSTSVRLCFAQPEATWPGVVERIAEVFEHLRR